MDLEIVLTTAVLGLIGGLTPGPIILLAFSEIMKSAKDGLRNGIIYLLLAVLTETAIGFFLVFTITKIDIPEALFHAISTIGAGILFYLAWEIFKIDSIDTNTPAKKTSNLSIVLLMLLNGPLWIFWLSICLPVAFELGEILSYGEYWFILIFELFMSLGLGSLILGFVLAKKLFKNKKIVRGIFMIFSGLLFLIALKIFTQEIQFFWSF